MDVLIVRKTTNFELHGVAVKERAERGAVPADVMPRLEDAHNEHYSTLERLKTLLDKRNLSYQVISRDDALPNEPIGVVVTVGGDGTLLAASHKLHDEKLLGIRSSESSVGYLCAADETSLPSWVEKIAVGDIETTPVTRAAAHIVRADGREAIDTSPVLNDFLYTNCNPAATTRYLIRIGELTESQRSSGLWVATGIGSTAAIFAAGGEKRSPRDPNIQFRIRELYRLGLTTPEIDGGFIDPANNDLVVENRCESALLAVDGQHGAYSLGYGDTLTFTTAPPLNLVLRVR